MNWKAGNRKVAQRGCREWFVFRADGTVNHVFATTRGKALALTENAVSARRAVWF